MTPRTSTAPETPERAPDPVVAQAQAPVVSLFGDRPEDAYRRMREIADVFKAAVEEYPQFVSTLVFNEGRRNERKQHHVTIEGWVFLGDLVGLYARTRWTERVEGKFASEEWQGPSGQRRRVSVEKDSHGYRAFAEAVTLGGAVVGGHEGLCLAIEDRWGGADEYARKSMAQTRAKSQALATVLRPLAEMAGFKGTPEEEMHGVADSEARRQAASGAPEEGTIERPIADSWKKLLEAIDSAQGSNVETSDVPSAKEWLTAAALATDGIAMTRPADLGNRKQEYWRAVHEVWWRLLAALEAADGVVFVEKADVEKAWIAEFPALSRAAEPSGEAGDEKESPAAGESNEEAVSFTPEPEEDIPFGEEDPAGVGPSDAP